MDIVANSASAITTIAVDLSGAVDCDVGPIRTYGYRGFPVVMLDGLQRSTVRIDRLFEDSNTGWGLRMQNCTDLKVFGGFVSGFSVGTYGSASNTRCTFYDVVASGNTTNTNVPSGQAALVGNCFNATL